MVIEQIYKTIDLITHKTRRGFIRQADKYTAVTQAMYDFFKAQLEIFRKTKDIPESIKRFSTSVDIILTDGVGNLPADFAQEISFYSDCSEDGVFIAPHDLKDRLKSQILQPDNDFPIAIIEGGKIKVWPKETLKVTVRHFRNPAPFVYATTLSVDGRTEIFNQAGSTDIELNYDYSADISRQALGYLGLAFQNAEAVQAAAQPTS